MPMIPSGTFASATIATSVTAGAKAKSGRCTGNGGDVQRHHGNAEAGKLLVSNWPSKTSRPWVKKTSSRL